MALTQKAGERTRVWPMTTALLALLVLSLALAPRAEVFIYWTNGDSIGRANLDGTGLNSHFIAVSTMVPTRATSRSTGRTSIGRLRVSRSRQLCLARTARSAALTWMAPVLTRG